MMEADKRLVDMTAGELMKIIVDIVHDNNMSIYEVIESRMNSKKPEVMHVGLKGIAEVLNVSYQTAQRLYSSGKLEGGYKQIGKKILVEDAQLLRDVAAHNMGKQVKNGYKRVSASIL